MQKVKLYGSTGLRIFFIVLCVVWAALIFSMSGEVAAESAERSGGISEFVARLFVPDFEKLSEEEKKDAVSFVDVIVRKTAHFCIYGVLGGLICLASLGYAAIFKVHLFRTALLGALYAASDEIHQYFVPGRGPGILDVLIDSVGVICGAVFILLTARFILKRAPGGKNGA